MRKQNPLTTMFIKSGKDITSVAIPPCNAVAHIIQAGLAMSSDEKGKRVSLR